MMIDSKRRNNSRRTISFLLIIFLLIGFSFGQDDINMGTRSREDSHTTDAVVYKKDCRDLPEFVLKGVPYDCPKVFKEFGDKIVCNHNDLSVVCCDSCNRSKENACLYGDRSNVTVNKETYDCATAVKLYGRQRVCSDDQFSIDCCETCIGYDSDECIRDAAVIAFDDGTKYDCPTALQVYGPIVGCQIDDLRASCCESCARYDPYACRYGDALAPVVSINEEHHNCTSAIDRFGEKVVCNHNSSRFSCCQSCSEYIECPKGRYGTSCHLKCSLHCGGDTSCDPVTGECKFGCDPGYTSDRCDERCSDHCGGDNSCHHVTGHCLYECDPGYTSRSCDTKCSKGSFGQDCRHTCSEHCGGDDNSCNHVNGSCDQGCDLGYTPPLCTFKANEKAEKQTEKLKKLALNAINSTNVEKTIEILDDIVNNTKVELFTSEDVNYIADVIQTVTATSDLDAKTAKDILSIADNVNNFSAPVLRSAQKSGNSSNRLIAALDTLGENLAVGENKTQTIISGGLALSVSDLSERETNYVVGLKLMSGESGDSITDKGLVSQYSEEEEENYAGTDAVINLPEELIKSYLSDDQIMDNRTSPSVRLVFNVYKDTTLFESSRTRNSSQVLNSRVVAVQLLVNNMQVKKLGNHRVRSVFQPLTNSTEPEEKMRNTTSCVFWNYAANNGTGGWDDDGCSHSRSKDGRDVCECDHLTNFAVLVSYYPQSELQHKAVLGYISLVGLTLSITCLACTILSFLFMKKLRNSLPQQVLFQLSLALILSWIVFLIGIERTSIEVVCIAVAATLHYLILASFMWMLTEGILLYFLLAKAMKTIHPKFLITVSIISWGLPALIVGIVCGIDYKHYKGGNDYCWLNQRALYYGFALPVGLILGTNVVLFLLVTISMCRRHDMTKHSTKQENQKYVNFRASFLSFIMLGLTWIFGFLAIEEAQVVFQYLFCVCATLQGVIMFAMMTLRNKHVRHYWRTQLGLYCPCVAVPDSTSSVSTNSKTGLQDYQRFRRLQQTSDSNNTTFTSAGHSMGAKSGEVATTFANAAYSDNLKN